MFSKSCKHGIRAILYISMYQTDDQFVPIRKISEDLNISFHFLTKILQILTQNQILSSFRGPRGGVKLARPAEEITLEEVIEAIDGKGIFEQCVLGLPGCDKETPCPLHDQWMVIRENLRLAIGSTTLAKLAETTRQYNLRITDRDSDIFSDHS